MTTCKLIMAASLFSVLFATGGLQSAPASAAFAQPKAQIANAVHADGVQEARLKRPGARRIAGGGVRPWRWCRNHPARCFRLHRHVHRHWQGYGVRQVGPYCHRHLYKVPGMRFHADVRCGHRHYRAYDSWVWAR